MFRNIVLFLIRHRASVLVLATVWAVGGIWVMMHTPMDAVPDLSENQVLVYADWPGQNPREIERRITRPLALALQGLPGVKTVRGSSDVGSALLHLIFENSVSFLDARRRVADGLAALHVQFPTGVHPRLAADGIPTGQIFWYTVEGPGMDLAELRSLQETVVAPQLRSVPGVAEVASVGGFVAEYQIEVDAEQLSFAAITLSDLESALVSITQPSTGQVVHTANSEMLIRRVLPESIPTAVQQRGDDQGLDPVQALAESVLPLPDGRGIRLDQIARVTAGPAPRRGVFEKDGNEAVAGIVHLRYGHNPLTVTRDVRRRLEQIGDSLQGIRLIPCYDRTPLILSAVQTVTRTLLESLLVTSICVVLILRHWRTSLVIVLTLPLVVLGSFLGIAALRILGIADVQTNIMSLAGIVVSIGVLVDSSIVVAENVTHQLRRRFGDEPIQGDVSQIVADACTAVGVPAILAMLMMLISFLPVFALQGIDGQMYRPLAWTKSLALLSSAILTVTLVPVLCASLIRGHVRDESASAIVRSVVNVYRPVLSYLIDYPAPLALLLCATLIAGAAATGVDILVRLCVCVTVGIIWWLVSGAWRKGILTIATIAAALALQSSMQPIGLALRLPLDEGMVMDMPITVPRISVLQAVDDLKARNMVLCRFPEVSMVTGKAGRADTPFDPAPLDMIESMVEFRPQSHWPSRRILRKDAVWFATQALTALTQSKLIEPASNTAALVSEIVDASLIRFDAIQREVCWQRLQLFQPDLSRELAQQLTTAFTRRLSRVGVLDQPLLTHDMTNLSQQFSPVDVHRLGQQLDVSAVHVLVAELRKQLHQRGWLKPESCVENRLLSGLTKFGNLERLLLGLDAVTLDEDLIDELEATTNRRWAKFVRELNDELRKRAATTWTQIVMSEVFARQPILDDSFADVWNQVLAARYGVNQVQARHHDGNHASMPSISPLPTIDPHRKYDTLVESLSREFAGRLWLWPHDIQSLNQAGGEMDQAVQMPGWANVWTRPIQNRVDMLATGVNSEVGVRVLGRDLDAVVQASNAIAEALREVPGAADVVADPIRGKGYVTIVPDSAEVAELGVSMPDLDIAISTAISGHVIGHFDAGQGTRPVRLKLLGKVDGLESLKGLPIPRRRQPASGVSRMTLQSPLETVPLDQVAQVRMVDGPATIKSENGWLRNYVRLNVQGRDPEEFVAAAQKHVLQAVHLPPGVFVEWTGQFEHAAQTRRVMLWMAPVTVGLILLVLYAAFHDLEDAGLMLLSVPGALAGGALCQWLLGFPFSVAVGIGYIACFGMAAATSMLMIVYLREAVENAGGLQQISLAELRNAVMVGAVHRLRPKLLTEATTILSLAPILWSMGMGADVIRPMAAPVLGGILIADEVVDLLLPIAFYASRRRRWHHLAGEKSDGTVLNQEKAIPNESSI